MSTVAPLTLALALAVGSTVGPVAGPDLGPDPGPAAGQDRALPATRNQKRDLEPLIDVLVDSFRLQTERVDEKDVRRALANALEVQVSWKAMKRYEPEVIRLIAIDLEIDHSEGHTAVEKNLLETYLRSPSEAELALVAPDLPPLPDGLDDEERKAEEELRRQRRADRTESQRLVEMLKYPPVGVQSSHGKCMVHDGLTLIDLKSMREKELDKDAARGMKDLAQHYEAAFEGLFGVEGDRDFGDRFEAALMHTRTDTALVAVLVKLRALARPLVYADEHVDGDPYRICDVQSKVIERVCDTVREGPLWEQLRADHAAMLADPKAFRREFKERQKGD